MITASHNPPCDNGVKIIDFNGHMLPQSCEPDLDALINSRVVFYTKLDGEGGHLFLGSDTRESGERLLQCARQGAAAAGVDHHTFRNF